MMGVLPAFNSRSHVNVIVGNSTGGYLGNIAIALPLGIGLCSLSLLTFLGNAMVVHAIRTERKLHTVSNMFILSLAIADLTVGLIVMPISSLYVLLGDWILGLLVCQLWLVIDYTASTASIFNLLILSLDRYWSIRSPLKYLCKRTKKRALGMIGIVWLISALWAIPIIGWHRFSNSGYRKHPDNVCETEFNDSILFKLTTSAANFFIPMILMVLIYYKIFCEIKRRGKIDIGRSLSVGCANHTRSLSKSNQKKQRKLFDRQNVRSNIKICASCSSLNNKNLAQIANSLKEVAEDRDSVHTNTLIDSTTDNRVDIRLSEREDKIKCSEKLLDDDRGKIIAKELSSSGSGTSNSGSGSGAGVDHVRHYQQLTLMSVKPEKPVFALEDYHGVKVEVEYINGGSVLNVINSGNSKANTTTASTENISSTTSPSVIKYNDLCDTTNAKTTKRNKQNIIKSSIKTQNAIATAATTTTTNTTSSSTPQYIEESGSEWSLKRKPSKKKIKYVSGSGEHKSSARPSIAFPVNEFCNECQCTAVAAAAATYHQNALRREESSRLRQEKKAARQLGVILGAFILCWMPYIITFIVTAYCTDCVSNTVHQVAIWMGYVNSFLNPFLYALCNDNFKQAFKKLLGRVKPQHQSYNFDLTHGTSFRCHKNNFS